MVPPEALHAPYWVGLVFIFGTLAVFAVLAIIAAIAGVIVEIAKAKGSGVDVAEIDRIIHDARERARRAYDNE